MLSNPEFRKNIWLELSPLRLILTPIVLAGIFFVNYLAIDEGFSFEFFKSLQKTSLTFFGIIIFAWGTKLVTDSLVNEFNDKTWDSQRMTSVGPWTMIWGKVFGSTIFTWYGGILCIAVYLITSLFIPGLINHLKLIIIMIFSGLICHTLSLSLILEEFSKKRDKGKINSSSYLLLMILALLFIIPFSVSSITSKNDIYWHFLKCSPSILILFSSAFFLMWSVVSIYRNMRIELQFTNGPWVWVSFVLSMMFYFSGFIANDRMHSLDAVIIPALYISYMVGIIITYGMAFIEPKYIVDFRRLIQTIREKSWNSFQKTIPAWVITVVINILVCIALIATSLLLKHSKMPEPFDLLPLLYPLNLLLFMLRDLSVLIYVNLKGTSERADIAALFYLMILYILVPLIVAIPGGEMFLPIFVPFPDCTFINGTLPVLIQCGMAMFLLLRRWKFINKNLSL